MSAVRKKSPTGLSEEDLSLLCGLVELPDIAELLRAAGQAALSEDSLKAYCDEHNVRPETVSRFIDAIYGPLAEIVHIKQPEGIAFWCYTTAELRRYLHAIDTTCTPGAPIHAWLTANPSMLMHLRIENAIHSSRLGDVEIDFASARELLMLGREARSRPERVVTNSFGLFARIEIYARAPWSVEMLLDIFDRLSQGLPAPENGWLDQAPDQFLPQVVYPYASIRDVLEAICDLANRGEAGADVHPVFIAILVERLTSVFRPFPMLNGLMGRFLWHCYLERAGYPVLGIAPYSTALYGPPHIPESRSVRPLSNWEGRAWTPKANLTMDFSWELEILDRALQDLSFRVAERKERDESLQILTEFDPALNPRQQSIIGRALRLPSATFRIAYHQTWHAIAYSTAREDFLELEGKGYLIRERQGHAYVYKTVPDLQEKIGGTIVNALTSRASHGSSVRGPKVAL